MLKHRIYSLDEVEPKFQLFYEKQEDGSFVLIEDARPDNTELLRHVEQLKKEKKAAKEALKAKEAELKARVEAESEEHKKELINAKKFEDLYKLEKEAKEKVERDVEAKLQAIQEVVAEEKRTTAVERLAGDLAGDKALLLKPHIENHVKAVTTDAGVKLTYMLDGVEVTKAEVEQHIKDNDLFKPILKGRQSSGAGTNSGGAGGGGGGAAGADSVASTYEVYFNPDHTDYSLTKQIELQKKNPQVHDRLVAKYNLTGY